MTEKMKGEKLEIEVLIGPNFRPIRENGVITIPKKIREVLDMPVGSNYAITSVKITEGDYKGVKGFFCYPVDITPKIKSS